MEEIVSCVKAHIDDLLKTGRQIVIAIDGNCTAGKTTLAAALEKEYDCNVFHMDDFFLRPQQRTAERYTQPGGNVDYERFRDEVLLPLRKGSAFAYRPFSCKTFSLGEPVKVMPKVLNIVEGTYSLHPYFERPYDLKIFLSVDPQVQLERISQRPPHLVQRFITDWIPMEKQYFDVFRIPLQADIQLDTSADISEARRKARNSR
jgi:uridine kinase